MKIGVRNVGREIVADAECEAEAVEPLGREFSKIRIPKRTIIEPRLVLDVAVEGTRDTADFICRSLNNGLDRSKIFERVLRKANAIGQFEHCINEATNVGTASQEVVLAFAA